MNSRAQEIRKKRLEERKAIAEENKKIVEDKKNLELKIEEESKKMFDWVLDMFENPTPSNTADTVYLSDSPHNKMILGYGKEAYFTGKKFNYKVMRKLVDMFNSEDGYTAEYDYNEYYLSSVTIRIE